MLPQGYEIAWAQFLLPFAVKHSVWHYQDMPILKVQHIAEKGGFPATVVVDGGEDFVLIFERSTGRIVMWQYRGHSVVWTGPVLNLWRAPTDNDAPNMAGLWRETGMDTLTERLGTFAIEQPSPQIVRVIQQMATSVPGITAHYGYTIYGSGDVVLEHIVCVAGGLPPLPRVGLRMTMPSSYQSLSWYGRGPHESYADRKQSARVDVYTTTVMEDYVPYIKPQEYGNKTDIRWLALTDNEGRGLLVVGAPTFEASAHPFAAQDLEAARHTYQLKPLHYIILNLDYTQSGLGSASCGPGVLPQYDLTSRTYKYSLRLRPLAAGDSPVRLSKQWFG
ncbi:MAG: hypothetical protein JXA33_09040 [Anaerolineae bacterium]|nr:hypothetical protein [Anaerolineae bacterium]